MRGFRSAGRAQRFLAVHGLVGLFRVGRYLLRAVHHRLFRDRAFHIWNAVTAGQKADLIGGCTFVYYKDYLTGPAPGASVEAPPVAFHCQSPLRIMENPRDVSVPNEDNNEGGIVDSGID